MSLNVALQSVAFYVLSCSTCAKINHRRKAKIQAKREREEKLKLETEQPGLYRHPSPFSTNPYWTEEIMMGPGPAKQKNDKSGSKNASQRALNITRPDSSYASSGVMSTDPGSSPTIVAEDGRLSGDDWNRKRYQREDEDLWGHDVPGPGQRIMDAIAKAGTSAGRLLESRLSKSEPERSESHPATYFSARNPPVNDLHPPVVSTQPASRDETRWMLQPPPPAKVMEGKERVVRGRSASNSSSRRGPDGASLSRQVTERLLEAKLQRGEPYQLDSLNPSRAESIAKSVTSNTRRGQYSERRRSGSLSSESSEGGFRRPRKPQPISISGIGMSSQSTIEHIPIPSDPFIGPAEPSMPEGASRSALASTISSSSPISQTVKSGKTSDLPLRELSAPSFNSTINSRGPPLQSLNDTSTPSPISKVDQTHASYSGIPVQ
ncbi:hypothetical protein B7463_g6314, partial [Scytalidium lignicola]